MDKKAQSFVDHIGHKELKPRYVVELLKIEQPQLPPAARSWPAYMAYTVLARSLIPCRERILAHLQSR